MVEREVSRSELYICDELFFSGTGVQVAWISEVDKRKIGSGQIGSITEMIQNLFFKIVTGEEKEYMKWLVSVY